MFKKITLAAVKGTTGSIGGSRQALGGYHGNQVRDASVLWEEMGRSSKTGPDLGMFQSRGGKPC